MDMMYTGFAPYYDAMMYDVDYDVWAERLLSLIRIYQPQPSLQIVDCACGTGELTVRFAKAGHSVTGTDLSPAMLEVAAQKARRRGLRIPFAAMDMRSLTLHRPVDVVNCSCDGVNYLTSPADVDRFFSAAAGCLKKNGLLLFDVSTVYKMETQLDGRCYAETLPSCSYFWRNAYDPEQRLVEMELSIFAPVRSHDGNTLYRRMDEVHVQRGHTAEEMEAGLVRAGFRLLKVFDFDTWAPASATTLRALYLAEKE